MRTSWMLFMQLYICALFIACSPQYPIAVDMSTLEHIYPEDMEGVWVGEDGVGRLLDEHGNEVRTMPYKPMELGVSLYYSSSGAGLVTARGDYKITSPIYDEIWFFDRYKDVMFNKTSTDGLAIVSLRGKPTLSGMIRLDGKVIIKPEWQGLGWFSEGLCLVVDTGFNSFFYDLSSNRRISVKETIKKSVLGYQISKIAFSQGRVLIPLESGEMLCLDKRGKEIFKKKFKQRDVNQYSEDGYAIVGYEIIDLVGNVVGTVKYDVDDIFQNGLAVESSFTSSQYGETFMIDPLGQRIKGPFLSGNFHTNENGLGYDPAKGNYIVIDSDTLLFPTKSSDGSVSYYHTELYNGYSYRLYGTQFDIYSYDLTGMSISAFKDWILNQVKNWSKSIYRDKYNFYNIKIKHGIPAYSIISQDGTIIWRNKIARELGLK